MPYKNYILIQKHLFRTEYFFADTGEHLADQLFVNEKIKVSFRKEYVKKGEKYILISCKVWNKENSKFFKAMEKLRNKMALVGNTDYEKFCKDTFSLFE